MECDKKPFQSDRCDRVRQGRMQQTLPRQPADDGPRPLEQAARHADAKRNRHCHGQSRGQLRQPPLFVFDQGRRRRATGKRTASSSPSRKIVLSQPSATFTGGRCARSGCWSSTNARTRDGLTVTSAAGFIPIVVSAQILSFTDCACTTPRQRLKEFGLASPTWVWVRRSMTPCAPHRPS